MPIQLLPGDQAPDFNLSAVIPSTEADGVPVLVKSTWSLAAQRGRPVILYAYPAAFTPGCTMQADDFNKALPLFAAAGYLVVGISPDGTDRLVRFAEDHGLAFPLLADVDHTVLEAYGAYGEKTQYGRKVVGVIRSTFVIGGDGRIDQALYGVKAAGHVDRLRAKLGI